MGGAGQSQVVDDRLTSALQRNMKKKVSDVYYPLTLIVTADEFYFPLVVVLLNSRN